MKTIQIKKLYKLHAWVGIITGILLFVIAFTGAVAVFSVELKVWANPEIRSPVRFQPEAYEQLIADYADKVGPEYLEEIHFQIPTSRVWDSLRLIYEGHFHDENGKEEHKGIVYEFEPNQLTELNKEDMTQYFEHPKFDMARFIAQFHADLHLGRPIGLILTGLLGLTLMVSIVTGILVHRKILAQLFTFRIKRNFSLMLNDGHKAMSIWGVMFHSVIAFTGAFLGLATVILVPAAAYVSFNGDQEKLLETFTAVKAPEMSYVQQPTKVADILVRSAKDFPELKLDRIAIMGYGDKNALVYVFGSGDDELGGKQLVYQGATAEFIRKEANFGRLEGATGKILDAMFPLHFGNFGGVLVKALWAILGISTALLPISGIMLWLERGQTAQNPAHSPATYRNLSRLLVGSCGGIVLATAILFPAQLIFNASTPMADHSSAFFNLFFVCWGLSCGLALAVKERISMAILGYATAFVLVLVMPMDAMLNNSHVFNVFSTEHYISVTIDLVVFGLGLLLLRALNKYYRQPNKLSVNQVMEVK